MREEGGKQGGGREVREEGGKQGGGREVREEGEYLNEE